MKAVERTYTFRFLDTCNMCGSGSETQRVMGKRLNRSQGMNPRGKLGITTTVVKCGVCGLVYPNPLPVPLTIDDHYGVLPEEYWKKEYFNQKPDYFKKEISTLKSLSALKGTKALDIGAGIGKCMIALSTAGYDAHGIEPSTQFYRAAIDRNGISPEKLTNDSVESASFPDAIFDFVTFGAVLEHLYDPSASIKKAMRWLKPGGIMHIEVPSADWLINKLGNTVYRLRGMDYVANISPMHEPFHLYEFSLKSFSEHAAKNGYKIVRHDYYVCQTYMPAIFDWLLIPYMRTTNTGMQLCVWLEKM